MSQSLQIYQRVLKQEAHALARVAERVNAHEADGWSALVEYMISNQSQLVFTGVGKSGIVAQKMASTFSSLGRPSFFLHPIEALHGDLGRVGTKDVLVLISKSGNTEELLKLIPYAKIPIERRVGILGAIPSPLAQQCGLVFDASVEQEACLNDLAPTTSTTVALGVGDALAVIYEHSTGLSKESFAKNHPAGRLGRSLTLKVKDVMIPFPQCAWVDSHATFKQALMAMTQKPVGMCAIVDEQRKLLGILVEGDVRRLLLGNDHVLESKITEVMNAKPFTISDQAMAVEALEAMEGGSRMRTLIPVVDGQSVFQGVVRHHELFRDL